MPENALARSRRWMGYGLGGLLGLTTAWIAFPGLPVLWGPHASAEVRAAGQSLFEHEWTPHDTLAQTGGDGLGPVFNARSCVACHFQSGVGGGGGNDHNVTAFEARPTEDRPEVEGGLIHKFAVANHFAEGVSELRQFFPIVPDGIRVENGCYVLVRDFDPIKTQSVNSTALFGAGWVDRISSKQIYNKSVARSLERIGREIQGNFEGIVPGRPRVLPDGRVGKFGWKAQFATLDEFVAAACANEIGLGNPHMEQARPLTKWKYPDVEPDLNDDQFAALVAFVETLPMPVEVAPDDPEQRDRSARGKALFTEVGCARCHVPDMGGLAGVYSDFLLHRIEERAGSGYGDADFLVPLPIEHPKPDEWKTPALWGVADSAPYFHDGGSATLEEAILRHGGGASAITDAYKARPAEDRAAIVAFLKTLKAPPDAITAPDLPKNDDARSDLALASP